MRVKCKLRMLRGEKSLRELAAATGISRGTLSRYERGIQLPTDAHVPALERAYRANATLWYAPHVWIEIEADDAGQPA